MSEFLYVNSNVSVWKIINQGLLEDIGLQHVPFKHSDPDP